MVEGWGSGGGGGGVVEGWGWSITSGGGEVTYQALRSDVKLISCNY